MIDILEKYAYSPNEDSLNRTLESIGESYSRNNTKEVLQKCFSCMDLTSLGTTDSVKSIEKFTNKVNSFSDDYPDFVLPASICVYPNFASVVRKNLSCKDVKITVVAASFPTSQTFLDIKLKEVEMAIENGADEIDIVLALNSFMAGDCETAAKEIRSIKDLMDKMSASISRKLVLKVILETGLLVSVESIAKASLLAMEAGADFIKTSTGKVDINATPTSALVMCECIKAFYEKTGKKVGFKAAGGISKSIDAVIYYSIVESILGEEWLSPDLFRLGVSRLANSLLSDIEEKTVTYF